MVFFIIMVVNYQNFLLYPLIEVFPPLLHHLTWFFFYVMRPFPFVTKGTLKRFPIVVNPLGFLFHCSRVNSFCKSTSTAHILFSLYVDDMIIGDDDIDDIIVLKHELAQ